MRFLDSERNEGRDLKAIATEIVDGFHDLLLAGLKTPGAAIRDGMLIKSAVSAKVHRILLISDDLMWVVGETAGYGWLGPVHTQFWDGAEEFRPKKKIDGKMVEMTDEMIAEAWSNPDWSVGDQLSQHQREHRFEIIATGPACVLMRDARTGVLNVDSNKNLKQYYKKESKLGDGW